MPARVSPIMIDECASMVAARDTNNLIRKPGCGTQQLALGTTSSPSQDQQAPLAMMQMVQGLPQIMQTLSQIANLISGGGNVDNLHGCNFRLSSPPQHRRIPFADTPAQRPLVEIGKANSLSPLQDSCGMNVDDGSPDSTSELTTAVSLPDALATYEDEVAAMIDGGVKQKDAATEPPSKKIPVG